MKIIDLSKTIENNMEQYPGDPQIEIKQIHTIPKNTWNLSTILLGSHTGTHVDAISHMVEDGESIDKMELNRFIASAYLVEKIDKFPENCGLLFDEKIDIDILPKILEANAIFVGGNISENLERELLNKNIVTYTDLINLDQLPKNEKFLFIGLPLKFKDGDGSPVRAVGILNL